MWGEGWGCLCVLTTVNLTADPFTVTILVFCCHDQMEEVNNTQAHKLKALVPDGMAQLTTSICSLVTEMVDSCSME